MLTAIGGIADRLEGFEGSADDYLVKPFAFSELAARHAAIERGVADANRASTVIARMREYARGDPPIL